jgi:hypothetical protein
VTDSHETHLRTVCRLRAIRSPFHVRRPDQTRSLLVLPVALLLSQLKTPMSCMKKTSRAFHILLFISHGRLTIIISSYTSSTTIHRLLIEQMHIVNLHQFEVGLSLGSSTGRTHRASLPVPSITPWHPDPSNSLCTMLANFMPNAQSTWGRASLYHQFLSGALLPCLHFCNSFYPARVH